MHSGFGPSPRTMFMQIPDKILYENTDKAVNVLLIKGFLGDPYIADTCHFNSHHIIEKVSKFLS